MYVLAYCLIAALQCEEVQRLDFVPDGPKRAKQVVTYEQRCTGGEKTCKTEQFDDYSLCLERRRAIMNLKVVRGAGKYIMKDCS